MSFNNPAELVEAFFRKFNEGDVEAIAAFSEPGVVMVAQPGQTVTGIPALREALNGFLAMQLTLTAEKQRLSQLATLPWAWSSGPLRVRGPMEIRSSWRGRPQTYCAGRLMVVDFTP